MYFFPPKMWMRIFDYLFAFLQRVSYFIGDLSQHADADWSNHHCLTLHHAATSLEF